MDWSFAVLKRGVGRKILRINLLQYSQKSLIFTGCINWGRVPLARVCAR